MTDLRITKWLPIDTLPDRGNEIVEILMSGGTTCRAPGVCYEKLPPKIKASLAELGHWANHKEFTPTHWRRLPPNERVYKDKEFEETDD